MDLSSSPIPPLGPDDHVRGEGETVFVYADLGCPHCAATWAALVTSERQIAFRHFPVRSKHPRSPELHGAAEAAGNQGAFFEFVDSLYADRGHVDDPHLWERLKRLGLDLDRFEADRRSEAVAKRVRRDFESGIRIGVAGTPAAFDARGRSVSL
jgi:protein-disulfide isomerase